MSDDNRNGNAKAKGVIGSEFISPVSYNHKRLCDQIMRVFMAGSVQFSRTYIFVIQESWKKNDVYGTYDFLGELKKFMGTYAILFL